MKQQRLFSASLILLLSALFLSVQTGMLLHDVQHPFHIDEAACDGFIAVKNHSHALVPSVSLNLSPAFPNQWSTFSDYHVFSVVLRVYSARAPPVSS